MICTGIYDTVKRLLATNGCSFISGGTFDLATSFSLLKPLQSKELVYFLFDGSELVYIGISKSIKGRIYTHKLYKEFTHVCYVECATQKDAADIERLLVKAVAPKYNIMHLKERTMATYLANKERRDYIRRNSRYY